MRRKSKKLTLEKTEFEKSAKEQYICVQGDCELRVLSFENVKEPKGDIEIMFIPGLITIFQRWEKVIKALNKHYKLHYIESREKITSKINRKTTMKIEDMSKDLEIIEKYLKLNERKYITITSSMGGSMVLENLAVNSISPIGSILIGPVVELSGPKWVPMLFRMLPPFAINWLKPLMRWGIRTKLVDAEKEPEQVEDYINALNAADGGKLREWTLKNINKYNGWKILPNIKDRIILVGTSTDRTHAIDTAAQISNKLANSTLVQLESNKAAHDLTFVEIAFKFMKELSNSGPRLTENALH